MNVLSVVKCPRDTWGAGLVHDLLLTVLPPPQDTSISLPPVRFFMHGVATVDQVVHAPLMLTTPLLLTAPIANK